MKPDRLEVLLWERIDGTITADDRAELESFLAEHREADELARDVADLAERLESLETVAPPEQLRARITDALADTEQRWVPTDESTVNRPIPLRRTLPLRWLPMAASLLVGVAAGSLLHTIGWVTVDESTAAGSMGIPSAAEVALRTLPIPDGGGTMAVSRSGSAVNLDLQLVRETGYEVVIESPDHPLELVHFDDGAGATSVLETGGGRIAFRSHGAGNRRLEVTVGRHAQRLHIEVRAGGEVAADAWIDLAGDGSQG